MLLIAKFIGKILTILNSEESPKQIAAGFAYGAMIGLVPLGLLPTLLTFFAFLININLGFVVVAAGIYKLLAFLIDPVANQVGYLLLTKIDGLKAFWTGLYNAPLLPYTRFNNTIVLGSLAIGILLLIPNYYLGKWFVGYYRTNFRSKVEQMKIVKFFKASTFYKYYESYRGFTGE